MRTSGEKTINKYNPACCYQVLTMEKLDLFQKKLSILQEISSAIIYTDNVSSIANLMLDLAINYTNAEKGSLMLNERDELYILAAKGMDTHFIKSYRVKIGEGIAGTVAKNGLPVLVEDIDKDRSFREKKRDRYRTKSFISCPIVSKNRLLGVLNINDKKNDMPFSEDEFELLKIIANHAAIALENAFLMTQLKEKAAELEDINKKLIETDILRTEFFTRISHELRTPLNSLKGAIYFLQQTEDIPKGERREFQGIISTEAEKLTSTIENLLNFLRFGDESRILNKTVLNIGDMLREIADSKPLKTTFVRKGINLKADIQDSMSDIVGDKIKVTQLFINLIEGLCHYLERGDTMEIAAHEDDFVNVSLVLSRRMPESIIPHLQDKRYIFQAEHQEDRLKLYLARNIIEIHHWDFVAENVESRCRITLTIPKSTRDKIEAFVNRSTDSFVEFISELLDLDICSIMLSDELTNELTVRSARGLDDDIIKRTRIKPGDRIAGWVALEGKPLFIENVENDPRFAMTSIPQYNTKSLISFPLKVGGRVIGVLNLNNKKTSQPLTMRDYDIASVVSERISHFIETLYSGGYRDDEFKQFITSFDSLLNAEKRYHKKRCLSPDLMSMIMEKLEASEEDKKIALYVSLIYDLGLMLIDESVLNKKRLRPSESRSLKVHPYNTVSLLNKFEYSDDVKKTILHHHERYDGNGYPDGLKGEEIPFISRVLSVVDSFCAMITDRNYRKAYTMAGALEEVKKGSGSLYDPKIVEALEEVIRHY